MAGIEEEQQQQEEFVINAACRESMPMSSSRQEEEVRSGGAAAAREGEGAAADVACAAAATQFIHTLRQDLKEIKREYASFVDIEELSEAAADAAVDLQEQQQRQQQQQHESSSPEEKKKKKKLITPQQQHEQEEARQQQETQQLGKKKEIVAQGVGAVYFRMGFQQETHLALILRFDRCGFTLLNAEEVLQQQPPGAGNGPLVKEAAALRGPYETIEQLLLAVRPHAFEHFQVQHVADKLLRQQQQQQQP